MASSLSTQTTSDCMPRSSLFATIVFLAFTHNSAPASADVINFSWDNDLFLGSDQGYTNGGRISYLNTPSEGPERESSGFAAAVRDRLAFLPGIDDESNQHATSFSLRQLIVTPKNISNPEPQYDDLPYAGYLSLSSSLWSWSADQITGAGLHLGVVGPESGAEATQKWVHKVTGSERPRGWEYQLGTDVVGGVQAIHGRKLLQLGSKGEVEQQVSAIGSAMLSTFQTSVQTGLIWRIGHNLPMNFAPDYAGSSTSIALPGSFSNTESSWSVFTGAGVEYTPYSYIEEHAAPYRFDNDPIISQIGVGGTWQWNNLQAALTLRTTTGAGDQHKDNFSFGTLSLSWTL